MSKALILFLCILLLGAGGIILAFAGNTASKPDVVAINDAVNEALKSTDPNEMVNRLTHW